MDLPNVLGVAVGLREEIGKLRTTRVCFASNEKDSAAFVQLLACNNFRQVAT